MKPSDEAQNVEPTNVQLAAASQIPSKKTATPPAIPSRPIVGLTLRAPIAAADGRIRLAPAGGAELRADVLRGTAGADATGALGRARAKGARPNPDQGGGVKLLDAAQDPLRTVPEARFLGTPGR